MKFFTFLTFSFLALSACNIVDNGRRINGDGNITSQTYEYKNFSSVDVENAMDVFIKQDSAFSIKIETDKNILDHINVKVDNDGTLVIENQDDFNFNPSEEIKVYISMPSANEISISGASKLNMEGKFTQDKKMEITLSGASGGNVSVRAPIVNIESSGASTLNIDGECRDLKADASGASSVTAFNLKAENAEVEASGASTVRVFSSISLKGSSHGASTIKYKGSPKLNSDVSGASSISKED